MSMATISAEQGPYALLLRLLEVSAKDARRADDPALRVEASAFLWAFCPEFAQRQRVPKVSEEDVVLVSAYADREMGVVK